MLYSWTVNEVMPAANNSVISHILLVEPFTRYVVYVEAQPLATKRHGAISNMIIFTTKMAGEQTAPRY